MAKKTQSRQIQQILGGKEFGHLNSIYGLCFSPDGKILVSSSFDETVKWFDAESGARLEHFHIGTPWLHGLAFSQDGRLFACGSKSLRIYNVADRKVLHLLKGHTHDVHGIAFSPSGRLLGSVSGSTWIPSDFTLRLWDTETGKCLHKLEHESTVSALAFHPQGSEVVTSSGRTAFVWDCKTGKKLRSFAFTESYTEHPVLRFSPDGRWLACGGYGKSAMVVDYVKGEIALRLFGSTANVSPLTEERSSISDVWFDPDGRHLRTHRWIGGQPSERSVHVWDLQTGREQGRFLSPLLPDVAKAVFSPDGRFLWAERGTQLFYYDLENEALRFSTPPSHENEVRFLSFSRSGERVVSADSNQLYVWDRATGKDLLRLEGPSDLHAWPSKDQESVFVASRSSKELRFLALHLGSLQEETLATIPFEEWAYGWIFLEREKTLILSNDDKPDLLVFDLQKGTVAKEPAWARKSCISYAVSPDDATFATGGWYDDEALYLVDSASRRVRKTLVWDLAFAIPAEKRAFHSKYDDWKYQWGGTRGIDFSPDGRWLAALSQRGYLALWDLETFRCNLFRAVCENRGSSSSTKDHLRFSPDGLSIALIDNTDYKIRFFSTATLEEVKALNGHQKAIESLAFSKDGRSLASSGKELRVLVWKLFEDNVPKAPKVPKTPKAPTPSEPSKPKTPKGAA